MVSSRVNRPRGVSGHPVRQTSGWSGVLARIAAASIVAAAGLGLAPPNAAGADRWQPPPPPTGSVRQPRPTVTPPPPIGITFFGRGYGHGVGMSQYGARGRALAGQLAPTILAHYYPKTTLGQRDPTTVVRVLVMTGFAATAARPATITGRGGGWTIDGIAGTFPADARLTLDSDRRRRHDLDPPGPLVDVERPGDEGRDDGDHRPTRGRGDAARAHVEGLDVQRLPRLPARPADDHRDGHQPRPGRPVPARRRAGRDAGELARRGR